MGALEGIEEVAEQTSFRVNQRSRNGRFGWSIPPSIERASSAREKKKTPKPKPIAPNPSPEEQAVSPARLGRTIGSYKTLIETCRARAEELGISRSELDRLANRTATLDDAATKAWKEVWTDWSGGKGGMPPANKIADIQNAARATGNIDLQARMKYDVDLMDRVERMTQLPLPLQHALETELQRRIRQGVPETGDELVEEQLTARTAAITKGLVDNPVATTVANLGDKVRTPPPLDFSSDKNLAVDLAMRAKITQIGAQNWQPGSTLPALDAPEVTQIQGMLANPDPTVKGRVFNAMASLPEDVRNATLAKIGKDRPELMVSVAAGSMMKGENAAPDVASSILRGQQAILADKGYLPKGDSEAAAFDQKFDEHLPASTFSLAARTDPAGPYGVAQGMVKARYADLSAQASDTTGKLNPERLTKAVDDVTGGVLTFNGGKLISPERGMPQWKFDRVMYGITDNDLAGVTTLNGQAFDANYLRNMATLESVGDGRYYVKLGKRPLEPIYAFINANTETPQKFVLDLRNRPLGKIPVSSAVEP
jgi:hypothetical protein